MNDFYLYWHCGAKTGPKNQRQPKGKDNQLMVLDKSVKYRCCSATFSDIVVEQQG